MKKTIILIHGLRGTHHGLNYVAEQLSLNYRVLTPDLPGSGVRKELEDKSIDGYSEWLHQYVCGLKLKQKPFIAGHSMGSIVVSHYLERYPDDTQKKAIFISPIFRSKTGQVFNTASSKISLAIMRPIPRSLVYRVARSKPLSFCISHFLTYDKTMQKHIDELHYRYSGRFSSAESILGDASISMRYQTVIPKDKQIHIIIGDKDRLTSSDLAHARSERAGVSISIISGTGHLINYEKPKIIAQEIVKFIQ